MIWNILFWEIRRFENGIKLSEKKPPLLLTLVVHSMLDKDVVGCLGQLYRTKRIKDIMKVFKSNFCAFQQRFQFLVSCYAFEKEFGFWTPQFFSKEINFLWYFHLYDLHISPWFFFLKFLALVLFFCFWKLLLHSWAQDLRGRSQTTFTRRGG